MAALLPLIIITDPERSIIEILQYGPNVPDPTPPIVMVNNPDGIIVQSFGNNFPKFGTPFIVVNDADGYVNEFVGLGYEATIAAPALVEHNEQAINILGAAQNDEEPPEEDGEGTLPLEEAFELTENGELPLQNHLPEDGTGELQLEELSLKPNEE